MTAPRPQLVRKDADRLIQLHRLAIWRQWDWDQALVYLGIAVVLGCPLIGLVIGNVMGLAAISFCRAKLLWTRGGLVHRGQPVELGQPGDATAA